MDTLPGVRVWKVVILTLSLVSVLLKSSLIRSIEAHCWKIVSMCLDRDKEGSKTSWFDISKLIGREKVGLQDEANPPYISFLWNQRRCRCREGQCVARHCPLKSYDVIRRYDLPSTPFPAGKSLCNGVSIPCPFPLIAKTSFRCNLNYNYSPRSF